MIERQRGHVVQPGTPPSPQQPTQREEQPGAPRPEAAPANLPSTDNWVIKGIVPGREGPLRGRLSG